MKKLKAKDIILLLLKKTPHLDINELHSKAYIELLRMKELYYEEKIEEFLKSLNLPDELRKELKKNMLKEVKVGSRTYSNYFEYIVRSITQSIQPLSGSIAELCASVELQRCGLEEGIHFERRVKRTDLIIYHPKKENYKSFHRVEVKNVSLRERTVRGLLFDGDSLLGFFNDLKEFTEENIKIIDEICSKNCGYCYVPPALFKEVKNKAKRFKLNTDFGKDMKFFVENGKMP